MRAHWAYFKYVMRHKWFVFVAGGRTHAPLWRLLIHDWSKFLPCEWGPYVRSFYKPDGSKREWTEGRTPENKIAFDRAWNHHQKANKHHWQYWLLTNDSDPPKHKALPMPDKYVREMVADWMGAGRAITGKWEYGKWYENNKEKILLEPTTQVEVESLIGRLDYQDRHLL